MKNQKGLTLPGTIVLVLLIAFIVFGVIYFIRIQTAKEGLEDLKTDLLLVQAIVWKISADYTLEKNEEVLVGTKLTDMQEEMIRGIQQQIRVCVPDLDERVRQQEEALERASQEQTM